MDIPGPKILNERLWEMHLSHQFEWTKKHRHMLYKDVDLCKREKILDAGCGIGLITKELQEICHGDVWGIDINEKLLEVAKINFPEGNYSVASLELLPFEDNYFDVTFCQFVLMWVKDPIKALGEMKRVTKDGGWILCAAEPDYGGKIDYPENCNVNSGTIEQLINEGADPFIGRKLKAIFANNGLKPEMGVFCNIWDDKQLKKEFDYIWKFTESASISRTQRIWLKNLKMRDKEAIERGERITFLPMFWGVSQKK